MAQHTCSSEPQPAPNSHPDDLGDADRVRLLSLAHTYSIHREVVSEHPRAHTELCLSRVAQRQSLAHICVNSACLGVILLGQSRPSMPDSPATDPKVFGADVGSIPSPLPIPESRGWSFTGKRNQSNLLH